MAVSWQQIWLTGCAFDTCIQVRLLSCTLVAMQLYCANIYMYLLMVRTPLCRLWGKMYDIQPKILCNGKKGLYSLFAYFFSSTGAGGCKRPTCGRHSWRKQSYTAPVVTRRITRMWNSFFPLHFFAVPQNFFSWQMVPYVGWPRSERNWSAGRADIVLAYRRVKAQHELLGCLYTVSWIKWITYRTDKHNGEPNLCQRSLMTLLGEGLGFRY